MVTCIILVILWALYTVAIGKYIFYIADLPRTAVVDVKSIGICSGFVLAVAGWVFFSIFAGAYILGC